MRYLSESKAYKNDVTVSLKLHTADILSSSLRRRSFRSCLSENSPVLAFCVCPTYRTFAEWRANLSTAQNDALRVISENNLRRHASRSSRRWKCMCVWVCIYGICTSIFVIGVSVWVHSRLIRFAGREFFVRLSKAVLYVRRAVLLAHLARSNNCSRDSWILRLQKQTFFPFIHFLMEYII